MTGHPLSLKMAVVLRPQPGGRKSLNPCARLPGADWGWGLPDINPPLTRWVAAQGRRNPPTPTSVPTRSPSMLGTREGAAQRVRRGAHSQQGHGGLSLQMGRHLHPPCRAAMRPSTVRLRPPWLWRRKSCHPRARRQTWRLKVTAGNARLSGSTSTLWECGNLGIHTQGSVWVGSPWGTCVGCGSAYLTPGGQPGGGGHCLCKE